MGKKKRRVLPPAPPAAERRRLRAGYVEARFLQFSAVYTMLFALGGGVFLVIKAVTGEFPGFSLFQTVLLAVSVATMAAAAGGLAGLCSGDAREVRAELDDWDDRYERAVDRRAALLARGDPSPGPLPPSSR